MAVISRNYFDILKWLYKVTQEFARQFGLPCDIIELFEQNKKK